MSTAATYEIYYCEAAAGTEWERKSCAESHGEKKNLMAFPNSSRGKKVSQDTKSEKKNEKGKKNRNVHTHTHTQMLSSTSCWGWGQCFGECPDSAASSREGWKMESRLGLGERGLKCPENNTSCREAGGGSEPSSSSWRSRNLKKQSASSLPAHPGGILLTSGPEGSMAYYLANSLV